VQHREDGELGTRPPFNERQHDYVSSPTTLHASFFALITDPSAFPGNSTRTELADSGSLLAINPAFPDPTANATAVAQPPFSDYASYAQRKRPTHTRWPMPRLPIPPPYPSAPPATCRDGGRRHDRPDPCPCLTLGIHQAQVTCISAPGSRASLVLSAEESHPAPCHSWLRLTRCSHTCPFNSRSCRLSGSSVNIGIEHDRRRV